MPFTMKNDDLLKKWLVNTLTDTELEDFKKSEDYDLYVKMIEKAAHFDVPDYSSIASYDSFKAQLKEKKTSPVIKLNSYKLLFRIAAMFIVSIGIYFLFFFNNITAIKTAASQNITFNLPDASSVVLNAESKAVFNKKKWAAKREVSLEGEAFFKVAKGSTFTVLTSGGTVQVLGTQFNVKNRKNYFEVKCFEGIVSVNANKKTIQLTKGNTYRIINGASSLEPINISQPKWLSNISSFKNVPLYEVLKEFERQYGIHLQAEKIDTKRLFTGSFVNNNLEQALASITIPFNLNYYKKDNSNKIVLYKSDQ